MSSPSKTSAGMASGGKLISARTAVVGRTNGSASANNSSTSTAIHKPVTKPAPTTSTAVRPRRAISLPAAESHKRPSTVKTVSARPAAAVGTNSNSVNHNVGVVNVGTKGYTTPPRQRLALASPSPVRSTPICAKPHPVTNAFSRTATKAYVESTRKPMGVASPAKSSVGRSPGKLGSSAKPATKLIPVAEVAPAAETEAKSPTSNESRQLSFHTLESPCAVSPTSELVGTTEGVDWSRVDVDPSELLREDKPQLSNVSPMTEATSPDTEAKAEIKVVTDAVPTPIRTPLPHVDPSSYESSLKVDHTARGHVEEDAVDVQVGGGEGNTDSSSNNSQPRTSTSTSSTLTRPTLTLALSEMSPATISAAPEPVREAADVDENIFVALRVRPGTRNGNVGGKTLRAGTGVVAGRISTGPLDEESESCVRVDVSGKTIDCSTIAAANVPVTRGVVQASSATANNNGAAGGQADRSMGAALGNRIRTMRFCFDHLFGEDATQAGLMASIGQRAVAKVLAGYNGTVLCYGQSGSGKTHTIIGPNGGELPKKVLRWRRASQSTSDGELHEMKSLSMSADVGMLPRMLVALFDGLEKQRIADDAQTHAQLEKSAKDAGAPKEDGEEPRPPAATYHVTFSALEVYNEELRDLLPISVGVAKRQLKERCAAQRQMKHLWNHPKVSTDAADDDAVADHVDEAAPVEAVPSPAEYETPKTVLNSYPSAFNSTGGVRHKSEANPRRGRHSCSHRWGSEDMAVLNAVSSSDGEEDEEGEDEEGSSIDSTCDSSASEVGDENDDDDGDAKGREDNSHHRRGTNGGGSRGGRLSELCDEDLRRRQHTSAQEPDPQVPAPADVSISDLSLRVSSQMTVGMLTSVSPSPERFSRSRVVSTSISPIMCVVDVRGANTSMATNASVSASTAAAGTVSSMQSSMNATAAATVGGGAAAGNAREASLPTRMSRRLPVAPGKAPPVAHKGKNGGSSSGTARGGRGGRSHHHHAATSVEQRKPRLTTGGNSATPLVIRQVTSSGTTTTVVDGLREHEIDSVASAMTAVRLALRQRQVGSTELNPDSSRAHTMFFIKVEQRRWRRRNVAKQAAKDSEAEEEDANEEEGRVAKAPPRRSSKLVVEVRRSTLTVVDLAGSERVGHTGANGLRLKEAQNINLSLSVLGNVMRLLSSSSSSSTTTDAHVPFRDSKLTRILQSSLSGNALTFLLCNISPDRRDSLESLSTLRFAKLAKAVKTKVKLNASSTEVEEKDVAASAWEVERQAMQAALRAMEVKLATALASNAAASNNSHNTSSLSSSYEQQQLTSYVWWLEEQLCRFASVRCLPRGTGNRNGVLVLPVSGFASEESVRAASNGGATTREEMPWWSLSPRPRTPPVGAAGAGTGRESNDLNTRFTPFAEASPNVFGRDMLTPPSAHVLAASIPDRQREMHRRLVAAAAAWEMGMPIAGGRMVSVAKLEVEQRNLHLRMRLATASTITEPTTTTVAGAAADGQPRSNGTVSSPLAAVQRSEGSAFTTENGRGRGSPSPSPAATQLSSPLQDPAVNSETALRVFLARCGYVPIDSSSSSSDAGGGAMGNCLDRRADTMVTAATPQLVFGVYQPPSSSAGPAMGSIAIDPFFADALHLQGAARPSPAPHRPNDSRDTSPVSSEAVTFADRFSTVIVAEQQPSALDSILAPEKTSDAPSRVPDAPRWGHQLLVGVRATVDTMRALGDEDIFYDPEDLDSIAS